MGVISTFQKCTQLIQISGLSSLGMMNIVYFTLCLIKNIIIILTKFLRHRTCTEHQILQMQQYIYIFIYQCFHQPGDIHGQFIDLMEVFRHGGDVPHTKYLFLGNYVKSCGYRSVDVMCLLLAYKIKYPDSIYLLRGVNENRTVNRYSGFLYECKLQEILLLSLLTMHDSNLYLISG